MNDFIKAIKNQLPADDLNELEKLSNELSLVKIDEKTPEIEAPKSMLNDDQSLALDEIINWIKTYKGARNENSVFALRGSAGTGKTTLLGEVLKEIVKLNLFRTSKICISAPTHKAKKVIKEKTNWKNSETLQSLLGLKLDTNIDDYDPNNPNFSQSGTRKIQDYDFIIIDEASMINKSLYKSLCECGKGCMIMFVGDHVQLNPVKEYSISLSLTAPLNSYTLTKPARQQVGNPLLSLLNILREDIENHTNTYKDVLINLPNNINELGEGYIMTRDSKLFGDNLSETILSDEFKQDKDYVRFIAWTNKSISDTNSWIKKKVFNSINTIDKDELLLAYRTIREDDDTILVNSDDYLVINSIEKIITDHNYPLIVDVVDIQCIDDGRTNTITTLKRTEENYKNYSFVYDNFLTEAKVKGGRVWTNKFYPFKDSILVLDEIVYTSQLNTKEKIKKDLDYGYGITAHKSQGSTFNTVFVNYKDIAQIVTFERDDKRAAETMMKRLLYVALSRASKKAYIIM